ncbi:hypothetical protein [Bradyrhizobium liaoningense]|uniref:hypothetical protein n=1 Tax=Bradyrhizobium liaoningense TaxID=43992 RepID=UPI002012642E|nr:hypothetical protein [Bradyrhizobium liaoningense]
MIGARLPWATLRDGIGDRGRRARLYGLMRYCSGRSLMPASVDDAVVADYLRYRAETTSLATSSMAHRSIARAWNVSAGENRAWLAQRLTETPVKAQEGPTWEDFPEGLRRDVDRYLAGLGKVRKGPNGKRSRPCSPKTARAPNSDVMIKGQEKLDSATKHKPAFMFDGAAYTKHHRDPRRRGSRGAMAESG